MLQPPSPQPGPSSRCGLCSPQAALQGRAGRPRHSGTTLPGRTLGRGRASPGETPAGLRLCRGPTAALQSPLVGGPRPDPRPADRLAAVVCAGRGAGVSLAGSWGQHGLRSLILIRTQTSTIWRTSHSDSVLQWTPGAPTALPRPPRHGTSPAGRGSLGSCPLRLHPVSSRLSLRDVRRDPFPRACVSVWGLRVALEEGVQVRQVQGVWRAWPCPGGVGGGLSGLALEPEAVPLVTAAGSPRHQLLPCSALGWDLGQQRGWGQAVGTRRDSVCAGS